MLGDLTAADMKELEQMILHEMTQFRHGVGPARISFSASQPVYSEEPSTTIIRHGYSRWSPAHRV